MSMATAQPEGAERKRMGARRRPISEVVCSAGTLAPIGTAVQLVGGSLEGEHKGPSPGPVLLDRRRLGDRRGRSRCRWRRACSTARPLRSRREQSRSSWTGYSSSCERREALSRSAMSAMVRHSASTRLRFLASRLASLAASLSFSQADSARAIMASSSRRNRIPEEPVCIELAPIDGRIPANRRSG